MYTLTRSCAPDQELHWEEVKLEEEEMKVEQYDDEDYDPWDESWWQDTEEEVAEEPAVYQARSIGVSNIHHSKLNMAICIYSYSGHAHAVHSRVQKNVI
jgi:hypothetical protein